MRHGNDDQSAEDAPQPARTDLPPLPTANPTSGDPGGSLRSLSEYRPFLLSVTFAVLVVMLLRWYSGMPREAVFMAGIFVLAALLWMTEALPPFATSLLVIALEIILLANPGDWPGLGFEGRPSPPYRRILETTADPVILLFLGGFLLARAAIKVGVDQSMSSLILHFFGRRPHFVLMGVMLSTALFSTSMSNTATAAMMIALVLPILGALPKGDRFRKALILGIPFAANIGGMATPIASPPNAVAVGFLRNAGYEISFLEWAIVAFPLMVVLLTVTWALLMLLYRPTTPHLELKQVDRQMTRAGWFVVGVFTVTLLLWLTDRLHGLPAAVVAMLPAVAFTASRLLTREDVNSLEWNVLILIGGGMALGAGMQMTGLDQALVELLPEALVGTAGLAVGTLVVLTLILSNFMSNTAAANLVLPVGISLAVTLPSDGSLMVRTAMSVAMVASASMALPVSTPPNAIVYARGLVSTRDLALVGSLIGILAAFLIILFAGPVIRFWGVN